jgi:hypothetical protein
MKPEYEIEDWCIVNRSYRYVDFVSPANAYLMGHIKDHPNCTPGKLHITSRIVTVHSDDVIETRNSIYRLGKIREHYKKFRGTLNG